MSNVATLINVAVLLAALLGAVSLGAALRARSRRPWARGVLDAAAAAAATLCLTGALAEVAARFVYDRPVALRYENFQEYAPGRFAFVPGLRFRIPEFPGWRASHYAINADGIRSAVPPAAGGAPPGERRVLFLGDSWTFGLGLEEPETYPVQAQQLLRAQEPGAPWVAVNAGIPGYNAFSSLALFEHLAPRYRPRVAVFTLGSVDDILPDLSEQLQRHDRRFLESLSRFALYRFVRHGISLAEYRGQFVASPSGGLSVRPRIVARQTARLRAALDSAGRVARRYDCRVVVHVIRLRPPTGAAPPLPWYVANSEFREFERMGARFVRTIWDPAAPGMMIPNDGHPTPAGARLLAEGVAPSVRAALGP